MSKSRWTLYLILALVLRSLDVGGTQFGDIPVTQVIGTPSITNDSNITLTLGGTPTDSLLKPFSITVGWSGLLPISRGGTGSGTASGALSALGGQPLDGDLTALAALSGTNNIYYRSGADTWSSVSIGSNMTFSGGVLNSTAGTPSVTSRGDADYTILSTDRIVALTAATTAPRNWIMPLANSVAAGTTIRVEDYAGSLTTATRIFITRSGSDTFSGLTQINLTQGYQGVQFTSNGASNWEVTDWRIPNGTGNGNLIAWDNNNNTYGKAAVPTSFLAAAASSGRIVISNGADWVASTPTYPNSAVTAGQVPRADGTNFTAAKLSITDLNNLSAASKLVGSGAAGAAVAEITLGTNLSMSGTTLNATGGGGAPTTATYITQTADATLSAEQALSSLGTGLVKNTTGTGVLSIATAGTDYVAGVANPGSQLLGLTAINGSATTAMRSDGAPALSQAIAPTWTAAHIWSIDDALTNSIAIPITLKHSVTGTATSGIGVAEEYYVENGSGSVGIVERQAATLSTVTSGLETAYHNWQLISSGSLADKMRLYGSGGLWVGTGTPADPTAGWINATAGFKVGGSQIALSNLANLSAVSKLMGSGSAGTAPVEITLGTNLSMSGQTLNATGGGGAPTTATYITQTADGTLSAEQALSSLGTGLLKNTTGTGVLTIATAGTDYLTPSTGVTTFASGNLSPLFTVTPSSATSGAITQAFTLSNAAANTVFGNNTGSTAAPAFQSLVAAQIPNLGGNPSALVGTAAINGSAQTYMRADGAPAINQAMAPTWTGQHVWQAASSIASSANATINDIWMKAATTTVTGGVPITNTGGFNKFQVDQPTITSAVAQSITNSSTVFIAGPPIAAGSATITNPYSLWVDSGTTRLDGGLNLGTTTAPATGVINVSSGYQLNGTEYPTAANGLVKRTAANSYAAATAGTDYEAALGNPGTNGFVLSSTTSGTRSWVANGSGGGTPGGSNQQVQFNDSGAFGGDAALTFDKSTGKTSFKNSLTIGIGPLSSGAWVDMPTTGPSGIGTGGAGTNPWVAYAASAGQWFSGSATGDVNYRNASGSKILMGMDDGTSHLSTLAFLSSYGMRMNGTTVLGWTNGNNDPGNNSYDVGLARNGVGVLEINNGTAGTLRDLSIRNLTISGTCTGCGGSGSPGGSDTQFQFNNAGAFAGSTYLTYSGGTVNQVTGSAINAKYNLLDPSDLTKKAQFNLSNIATATTRVINVPNADSTTIQADTGASNNFLTAVSAQGVISKAQPAFTNISGTITNTQAGVSGSVVGTSDTQTLTNKRITPREDASTSGSATTWSPNADTTDIFTLSTTLAVNVTTINNPSGTPQDGQKLMFRIKSDGSVRNMTWSGTQWRASTNSGAPAFPTATTASKTVYIGVAWNATDSKWDLLAVQDGF